MATKSATSTGTGFGALALRKKNTGPPMKWSTKKAGPGLVVEGDTVSYPPSKEPSKGQYSVQLLDVLCNASQCVTPLLAARSLCFEDFSTSEPQAAPTVPCKPRTRSPKKPGRNHAS